MSETSPITPLGPAIQALENAAADIALIMSAPSISRLRQDRLLERSRSIDRAIDILIAAQSGDQASAVPSHKVTSP